MKSGWIQCVALCLLLELCRGAAVDDTIHYFTAYKEYDDIPEDLDLNELSKTEGAMKVKTNRNENFVCLLPKEADEQSNSAMEYAGPSPSELIMPLYKAKACSFRMEAYWSYEVCHGRYILQYHDDGASAVGPRKEYYLGNLHVDYTTMMSTKLDAPPQTRKIADRELPVFPVLYTQGTSCDITNKPRSTTVLYVCVDGMQNSIHSISEVSSCVYEVVILASWLCQHPAYKPKDKENVEIVCYNTNEDAHNAKPLSQQEMEKFHADTFKREYTLAPQRVEYEHDADVEAAIEEFQRSMNEERVQLVASKKRYESPDTLANNKAIVDDTVNRLLTGRECMYGGAGWWHYEFCMGRHVLQYHQDERGGERTEIVLGRWDEAVHKAWVKEKADRQPRKLNNRIIQISHIYTKGDICAETKAHRSTEVRIRCKASGGSSVEISIALLEPTTCNYILIVESERFCEPLQYADEYGIIELEPAPKAKEDLPGPT